MYEEDEAVRMLKEAGAVGLGNMCGSDDAALAHDHVLGKYRDKKWC